MKLKEIKTIYKRVLNTGNYSSATIGIELTADLDESEDPAVMIPILQHEAREAVRAEYMRLASMIPAPEAQSEVR